MRTETRGQKRDRLYAMPTKDEVALMDRWHQYGREQEQLASAKRQQRAQAELQQGSLAVAVLTQVPDKSVNDTLMGKAREYAEKWFDRAIAVMTADETNFAEPDPNEEEETEEEVMATA